MEGCSETEWVRSKISELIELYRSREVLWNPKHPSFKDKNLKNYAWGEIAVQLQVDKFEVQTKMKNLTTCFRREAKKEKSGAGASQSVKWWAFESLLFLSDKTTPRTITEAGIIGHEVIIVHYMFNIILSPIFGSLQNISCGTPSQKYIINVTTF
jgi:hypothetical protein